MSNMLKKIFALALVLGAVAGSTGLLSNPAEAISCRPSNGGYFPCQ